MLTFGAPLGALATGAATGIARCSTKTSPDHFDFLVIGGGSGGVACARRAAMYGKKVVVVERGPDRDEQGLRRGGGYGGTCVNIGCVPKKLMYTAATHFEAAETAPGYGVQMAHPKLDWAALVEKRDAYVARLNTIYTRNLDNAGITHVEGFARFVSPTQVERRTLFRITKSRKPSGCPSSRRSGPKADYASVLNFGRNGILRIRVFLCSTCSPP